MGVTGACFPLSSDRMSARRISFISSFALLLCIGFAALELTRPLVYVRLCNLYRDAIARTGRTTSPNPNLVFLAIDAHSVSLDQNDVDQVYQLAGDNSDNARALRLMSKGFPWSREVYALVLDKLVQAGARVVVFDLNFPTATDNDSAFHSALDRYAGHVVVGSNFNFLGRNLVRPCETLIPQTLPIDSRVGFTNFWPDDDVTVRRAQYRVTLNQIRDTPNSQSGSEQFASLAAAALIKAGFAQSIPDDVDPHSLRLTAAPGQGFPAHSLFEIFLPTFWQQNYLSGEFFRDKIVIVGAEGNWQHDEHPTAFGEMPGPELHLNAINAAIHHEFIRELPPVANLVCIGLAAVLAVAVTVLFRTPWVRLVLIIIVGAVAILASLLCFNHVSLYFPIVGPLNVFGITAFFGLICDFAGERIEKMRVRRVLERYVSRDVVHELVDHPNVYRDSLGGVTKPVVILFSDIRAYSAVTARSSPATLVAQLNEYFSAMVECVFENSGTLDKFIGDALMASWGSLDSSGARKDAVASVRAALSMRERIRSLNKTWSQRGWPELRVGMGLNYGEVVVGNIGSPQRMEFTLIGDAVNVSWKLQEMTKTTGTELIVSESVASLVGGEFNLCSLGSATVDDSHQSCEIFTILTERNIESQKEQTRNESWDAEALFVQKDFPGNTPPAPETAKVAQD
jgi:adenylate cyclase